MQKHFKNTNNSLSLIPTINNNKPVFIKIKFKSTLKMFTFLKTIWGYGTA